jgi:hypothetical protein
MFSALSDATGQIDPKYLISYWLPAMVATFASANAAPSALTNTAKTSANHHHPSASRTKDAVP